MPALKRQRIYSSMRYIAYFCLMQAVKCSIYSDKAPLGVIICIIVLYLTVHTALYCIPSKNIA